MFTEAWIDVAGEILQEPIFEVTKQGVPYCKFKVKTTNNTAGDREPIIFNCFLWQGQQYNLLKQLNLVPKDEVFIRGMFSINVKQGNIKPLINLQIYINYIKVIHSAAAERAKEQLNSNQGYTNIPMQERKVVKISNQEVSIDKGDNPF